MGYCTAEDILNVLSERELINLTNDSPSLSSKVDSDRFEAVSDDTDSLINGYIRSRYNLPLAKVPTVLKQIATDICAYRLYLRRPQDIPEHIKTNYYDAISRLKDIQKGNLILEVVTETGENEISKPKSGFRTSKTKEDRMFSERVMRMYRGL